MTMDEALASLPIIAIVRGVEPDQAVSIGEALFAQGVRAMEVPLNSPKPLESIKRLATRFGDQMLVGAGTVLSAEQVASVKAVGGQFIVSPNTDAAVIGASLALGLDALPGFSTPTEAFAAIAAGAGFLKLFPASSYGSAHVKAIRAVLPKTVKIIAVGGIGPSDMAPWIEAGVSGFGLGSELYKPGMSPAEVGKRTAACVVALGR
jgi:2-dehydro-3-deoxyphosphogalactonate aldolase